MRVCPSYSRRTGSVIGSMTDPFIFSPLKDTTISSGPLIFGFIGKLQAAGIGSAEIRGLPLISEHSEFNKQPLLLSSSTDHSHKFHLVLLDQQAEPAMFHH